MTTHRTGRTTALLVAVLGIALSTSAQTTHRVPQDHPTIQAAVDAAVDGDTIQISKGVYPEFVTVSSLSDLTILGKGKPVLDGSGAPVDGDGLGSLFLFDCTDVLVKGLVARPFDANGFTVSSSTGVTLERCRVEKPAGADAIGIFSSSDVTVDRCRIADVTDDGIDTSGSMTDLTAIKTRIQRTGGDGVHAIGRAVTLEKVSVTDVGGNGYSIDPIAGPEKDGFSIDGPVLITDCRATKVVDDGLDLTANGAVIENLKCKDVGDDGVRVADSIGVSIDGVRLAKLEGKGMQIFGVTDSMFTDFRMAKPDDGVYVDFASSGNTFTGWKVKAPDGEGFDLDGPNNTYIDNVVTKAGGYGFSVITSGNTFTGNKAKGSGLADLQDTGGGNTYEDNDFGTTEEP